MAIELKIDDKGNVIGPGGKLTKSFVNMLDRKAREAYDENDELAFYGFSDDALAILWSLCQFPFGRAYDDEVYTAIDDRRNSREIFDMGSSILKTTEEFKEYMKNNKTNNNAYDESFMFTEELESHNKAKITEAVGSDTRRAVARHFNYRGSDAFMDVIDDLVERAMDTDSDDIDEAISQAIDDGLIYNKDIWEVREHYEPAEITEQTYEDLYGDLYAIVSSLKDSE